MHNTGRKRQGDIQQKREKMKIPDLNSKLVNKPFIMKKAPILLLLLTAVSLSLVAQTTKELLYVNSKKVECQALAPQKCLQIKDAKSRVYRDWENFYGSIDGFDYQEGYLYTIEVEKTTIPNVPADASSLTYTLIKVLGKKIPEVILDIADKQTECEDPVKRKCMLAKESDETEWKPFNATIKGFTYQPGTSYQLLVQKKLVSNPEEQGYVYQYTYKKTLSKKEQLPLAVKKRIDQKKFILKRYNDNDSMYKTVASLKSFIQLNIDSAQVSGNDGCNGFGGKITSIGKYGIRFGSLMGTLMFCEQVKDVDRKVRALLGRVNQYQSVGNKLLLLQDKKLLLEYEAAIKP